MKRISTATKVTDKFGAGKHGFTNGNVVGGIPATDLEDSWFDSVQEEIAGVIEALGVALDGNNRGQLLAALKGRLLGVRSFPVGTTTYVPTPGAVLGYCKVKGAGGGSGGCAATGVSTLSCGGGGGGGAYAEGLYPIATLTGQIVTVGTGGTAGPAGSGSGGTGGTSSIGSVMTAPGGPGGQSQTAAQTNVAPWGGTAQSAAPSGGNVVSRRGGAGTYGIQFASQSSNAVGGPGGAAGDGSPGPAGPATTGPGNPGVNPGSGAAGAAALTSAAAQAGAVGAIGEVLIFEYA